jgi:hypothetical protein
MEENTKHYYTTKNQYFRDGMRMIFQSSASSPAIEHSQHTNAGSKLQSAARKTSTGKAQFIYFQTLARACNVRDIQNQLILNNHDDLIPQNIRLGTDPEPQI